MVEIDELGDLLFDKDQGVFSPRLSVIFCPPGTDTSKDSISLHEIAHALTFVGTKHYAKYATDVLSGKPARLPHNSVMLLEAVPTLFGRFGGRHSAGSVRNQELIDLVEAATRAYGDRYKPWLPTLAFSEDPPSSGAAAAAGISGREAFQRTVALTLIQAALEEGSNRMEMLQAFHKGIISDHGVRTPPGPGDTVELHIRRLLGLYGDRIITDWFTLQLELAAIFKTADPDILRQNLVLIPALAQIELFGTCSDDYFDMSLFAHDSDDSVRRLTRWTELVAGHPHRPHVRENISRLAIDLFVPSYQDRPVLPEIGLEKDPTTNMLWRFFGFREFLLSLPRFFEWFIDLVPGAGTRLGNVINEESVDRYLEGYASEVAKLACKVFGPSPRLDLLADWPRRGRLRNGMHPKYGATWFISVR